MWLCSAQIDEMIAQISGSNPMC